MQKATARTAAIDAMIEAIHTAEWTATAVVEMTDPSKPEHRAWVWASRAIRAASMVVAQAAASSFDDKDETP